MQQGYISLDRSGTKYAGKREWHENLQATVWNGRRCTCCIGPVNVPPNVFQAELGGDDLTPRQYAVLVTVSQNEGLSQTQLVEQTGIDRSTLADIVRRMLKKGLLQRRRTKDDARAYAVKLTDEGGRILSRLIRWHVASTSRFLRACRPAARALPAGSERDRAGAGPPQREGSGLKRPG